MIVITILSIAFLVLVYLGLIAFTVGAAKEFMLIKSGTIRVLLGIVWPWTWLVVFVAIVLSSAYEAGREFGS